MPRPIKCRRVATIPDTVYFKPQGIPLMELEEIVLTVDEIEAIRLKDVDDLEQGHCAAKMDISRATYQRVLESARRKIADALLNGKAIKIQGGAIKLANVNCKCINGCEATTEGNNKKNIGVNNMKIAIVTDDGQSICQHFGRAGFYSVVTIENGKVTGKELRPKAGHHVAGMQHESQESQGAQHGFDANARASHAGMMANITDCQLVIAGGMGWGAQVSLKQAGIAVHMTDVVNIDEAVQLYIQGKLPDLQERLH
jgi:predicted DNA-binding protein (UPF0251 family)/predicted Fe-Mo cluster-binding NifX family protein